MRRRRRLIGTSVFLLVVAGAAGYRTTHNDASPVLATVAVGSGGFNASLDEWTSRLYVFTFGNGQYIVDTRTGALEAPNDVAAQQDGGPANHLAPQLVTGSSDGQNLLIVDDRSLKLRYKVPVNVSNTTWFLDDATSTFYVIDQAGAISIVDVPTGRIVAHASQRCALGSGNPVLAHSANHLFLSCADGSTEMHDARTGKLLRTIPIHRPGDCTCRRIADDLTGRVFLPSANDFSVVDSRSGALVRTLPMQTWSGGSFEFDSHTGAVTDLDPRSGDIVVAPYRSPSSGLPEREVLLLDGRTGAIARRWPVPENPLAVLVNPLTGHLLVASAGPIDAQGEPLGAGTLSVLDMGSGATLQQVSVGMLPGELFADRRAKHLLVMNRTTTLDGNPLQRPPTDNLWPRALRSLKQTFGWLPFSAPVKPSPPRSFTVTLLDLSRL
jgi:DNA-binding beta-propeller fold protein YncE